MACTCFKGDGDVVHKSQINVPGTVVDSSMSNVFTTSGSGTNKVCVKRENLLDVAGSSKVIRNNNKDGINPLVIIIFLITIRRYHMFKSETVGRRAENTMTNRKTNRRTVNGL
jgi:hypothetical protein